MKVGLVNQLSFRATDVPTIEKQDISWFKNILTDNYSWSKTYSPEKDEVSIQSKVAYDAGSYTITNDGTVISGINLGKPEPTVVLEKNKYMADYVKNMKEHEEILDKFTKEVPFTGNEAAAEVENIKKSRSVREGAAGIWKFMAVANQMANSALKGLFYGALTGAVLLSGSWLFKALPKAFTKEGPTLWNTIRHPLKNIGKSGKIIAGVGSAAVLGYQLVTGKLEANQRTATIDHKLKIGHRDK